MKNLIVGIVLILIAAGLAYNWQGTFFWTMVALIEGAIVPFIAFVGLVFILIGLDDIKSPVPAVEEKPEPKKKK